MWALMLIAGFFLGTLAMVVLLLRLSVNRRPTTTMHGRQAALSRMPLGPMPPVKPEPQITDWDVARTDGMLEPGRVEYRFLGVTGEEEA